jgi:protein-S-isoprenylcysteine O-methyltransferase Ste14
MAPLPYSQGGARVVFYAVLGIWVVLEWWLRFRSHLNRRGAPLDRSNVLVVVVFVAAGLGGAFVLAGDVPSASIHDGRWAIFVAGVVLMCVGIALRQWAVAVLGRFFTIDVRVQPGQTVVDRGPYRWVRHPSYTGMIVTFLGVGLALGNWLALAAAVIVPTIGLVLRIRSEERALLSGLGEPYRRYATGRPRLFPGLW